MKSSIEVTRRGLLVGSGVLAASWSTPGFSQTLNQAVIKVQQQYPHLSPKLYGGFIEHIGNLINHSLWSEVLDDRKFYYGVISTPEVKPKDFRGAMAFVQKWLPIGPMSAITLDSTNAYVGKHSPVINIASDQAGGIKQQGLALRAGIAYVGRIVVWADSGVKIEARLILGEGAELTRVQKIRASKKWKTYKFKFDSAVDTESARFEIVATGSGKFGVGAVSLMPADNQFGFRADMVQLMKGMHCPILRMPGGNFVSAYDWKDTIGEADLRPPVFDPVWSAVQPNDVGVDELLKLCELINSEPFWCVNTGFGEVRSGAELVEYINGDEKTAWGQIRAQNGRKTPYQVKYWAIGNEMYGHWQMGHMARDQYVIKHNLFADAMRAVDPSIYIVAPGGFVDEMTTGQGIFVAGQPEVKIGSERDWAYGMFKHSWGKFDALGTHAYPPENKRFDLTTGKLFDVTMPLNEWARQSANRVATMADAWDEYKKHFPKLNEGKVKVFYDEWAYGFQDSLKNSLALALTFHEFFRHTDFIDMAGFTMATGWFDFTRTAATINSKGLIFQLYQQHFGAIPVAVGGDLPPPKPAYPIGGDQPRVNTGSANWPLDVSASLTADGQNLIVAVVNANEQAHTLTLKLESFLAKAQGECWKYTGTGLAARNAVNKPPEVLVTNTPFDASNLPLRIAPLSVELYKFTKA